MKLLFPAILPRRSVLEIILLLNYGLILSAFQAIPPQTVKETAQKSWRFDFGNGKVKKGYLPVTASTQYSEKTGFGLIGTSGIRTVATKGNKLSGDFVASSQPFYFAVNIPEGHYKITLGLGGPGEESETTVKAESRRLMLEQLKTTRGKTVEETIAIDVRNPRINSTETIRLKPRELNYLNWDNRLTLEFNGNMTCLSYLRIEPAENLPTLFLAGNSTVTDQENEPWASWGQMIPRFLKPGIVVANYAESGETLISFKSEKRLQKILSQMKPGDFLIIEFAHNDQKPGSTFAEAFTTYKNELKYFIREARKRGGQPILVTSMHRRRFGEDGKIINTLENYPEAMRQTAAEEQVPLIDLNQMSKDFYEALDPETSKKAFVHYPAGTYPGQTQALADDTHFNPYGAYELAKCIVEGIKANVPELAKYLREGLPVFDPSNPDPPETFVWPESPSADLLKPDGN